MNINRHDELVRKVGLFGLSDLRRLAPIGDLGYMNGWHADVFMDGGLECAIYHAMHEQGFVCDRGYTRWGHDHHSICTELGLSYSVDSGD